jgi:hypothetical protein
VHEIMIRSSRSIAILFVLFTTSSCCAGELKAYEGPLKLLLRPAVEELVPYEPLFVSVWVQNDSVQDVTFPISSLSTLRFYSSSLDAEEWVLSGWTGWAGRDVVGYRILPPGEIHLLSTSTIFSVRYGWPEKEVFPFSLAGAYRVKSRLHLGPAGVLESEPLPITVVEGAPEDAGAASILVQGDTAKVIQRFKQGEDVVPAFESILQKYPSSVLADYAQYYLGVCYLRQATSRSSCDSEAIEKAILHFESVGDRRRVLRVRALLDQGRLISSCDQASVSVDVPGLLQRLEEKSSEMKELGLEEPARHIMKKMRRRVQKLRTDEQGG